MMATNDKESSANGMDNRPHMLEESDFESWKIRIERYIRSKPLGKLIWNSIKDGPTPHPMIIVTTGEGKQQTQVTREKIDEEFTEAENKKECADIQATIQAGHITTKSVQRRALGNTGKHVATGSRGNKKGNQGYGSVVNAQGKLVKCYNCRGQGHVAKECKEKKRAKDSQWFKDKAFLMEAKEKGVVLDAEAEAFLADMKYTVSYAKPLAITTTIAFELSYEDAYNSDVDEGPHVAASFMANQTGPSTREGSNNDTDFYAEIQTYDNHLFDNLNHQVSQEMHRGEQLDFDVDSVIDGHDNTIPYHQYQLNNEVKSVPTDVSSVLPGGISVITILDDLRSQLAGHIKVNKEQSFANDSLKAELERYKTQVQNLKQSKVKKDLEQLVFEHNKRNADLEEQLMSLKQQLLKHVKSHKSLKTECKKLKNDKNALEESYLKKLVCLRNTNKVVMELLQSYGQPLQTVPMLSKRLTFPTKDLQKTALGHSNPLYLKIAQLCCLALYLDDVIIDPVHTPFRVYDSEEALVQAEVSRTKMLERMNDPLCKVSSKPVNYAKINSLSNCVKEHFRNLELEAEILKLKEEFTAVRIKNDSLRDDNVSIKKRYQDLYKSKAESNSNAGSGAVIPEKPKVLAPGLYAMMPKYVPPQKRNNKEVNTPLPRKETVSLVKKTHVSVNLSTGIKSVTKAIKSKSKCEMKTHRNLLARSENMKRVENPLRNFNKRNRVDSSLSVKRAGFISNSVSVFKTSSLESYCKIFASVGSKWKPTERNFTLGDMCPLTRITKPKVMPLEKSRSVSTSEPAINVIVTPRLVRNRLSSVLGFDQTPPSQSPVIQPPSQETSIKILHDQENEINSVQTFLRKFNCYSFFETPKVLLLAWDRVFEIKDAFGNKQYKPEDMQELFRKLFNDVQNIHVELAEYINTPGWNRPAFYDDDDDDDVDYTIAITPVLSTDKPDNSLSMGDEHLDTIPATESDEVIKSSVKDLVPIPSEFEGILDTMCDVHLVNNYNPLEAKDHFEIVINSHDDISSSDDDSLYKENIEVESGRSILFVDLLEMVLRKEQLAFLLSRIDGIILTNILDRWVWSLEASGEFSIKSVRQLINDSILPKEEIATRWVKVTPIKINVFA
nr:RNA-directed DNA polymerase, eukaryota [Tanacetum cinerariifolium]